MTPRLAGLALPIPWENLGFPDPMRLGPTVLTSGGPAWRWDPEHPQLGIPRFDPAPRAGTAPGWSLDHVVVLVPDLEAALAAFAAAGIATRLEMTVGNRPTAFLRGGVEVEVIESPVRAPALYGVALTAAESLEVLVLRWRAAGRDVTDPAPALQPDRRIFTVRDLEAGLAVMSAPGTGPQDPGQTPKMS